LVYQPEIISAEPPQSSRYSASDARSFTERSEESASAGSKEVRGFLDGFSAEAEAAAVPTRRERVERVSTRWWREDGDGLGGAAVTSSGGEQRRNQRSSEAIRGQQSAVTSSGGEQR